MQGNYITSLIKSSIDAGMIIIALDNIFKYALNYTLVNSIKLIELILAIFYYNINI